MAARRPRPCLVCGALTRNASRCDTHQQQWQQQQDRTRGSAHQRGYTQQWRTTAARAVARHRTERGDWCPGWRVPAHASSDLTADHIVPKAAGGTDDPENIQVLCRSCNSRKHAQST
ncbi:HNH endonuclease signature motif containing protein [Streptomyces collinus]|uniref:HNH endonuclease signature motif containing protein n=1 Tax=Streptomyces collinus TaxID=42684 RepID=UPI0036C6E734